MTKEEIKQAQYLIDNDIQNQIDDNLAEGPVGEELEVAIETKDMIEVMAYISYLESQAGIGRE